MTLKDRIDEILGAQPLMQTLGAQVTHVAPGEVDLEAAMHPEFLQHNGFGHAALTFALGDTAGGGAAITLQDEQHAVLTSEISTHLLAPAKGTRLIARGRVIKPGRRLVIIRSDVYALDAGKETHIATLTGTMVPYAL
ncbi:MAG: PaaI family thioesterase [Pelagimonas sp.]|jgi:uncharacterized protein (TIGR00369 family)|nr:PaaI family thioesterase [Pelagimonas sp.]